jgi:hypothetical protein
VVEMIKKIRIWFYGFSYRVRMKLIHKAGLCQPAPNAFLAERSKLSSLYWNVPYRCDWCGLGGSKQLKQIEFLREQHRTHQKSQRIHRLFG